MEEENQNQAIQQADPNYKETLLVRNEDNGNVEAVSELKHNNNRYAVHTTQPISANKPAFYDFKNSNAVAAFITGFKSQKDNPITFRFLKVPVETASNIVDGLLRLINNPKDEDGNKLLRQYTVYPSNLEKVKFEPHELHLQELKEVGIVVSPEELERLQFGLPPKELHEATIQVGPFSFSGQFALHPYRDHNGEAQVGFETGLAQPEYLDEKYKNVFSTSEKELIASGKTLDRLVKLPNPFTKQEEWSYVGFNTATNRLIIEPKNEVETPRFYNGVFIDNTKQEELGIGGRVLLTGCHNFGSDAEFSGPYQYNIHKREFEISFDDRVYKELYIPKALLVQLSDKDLKDIKSGLEINATKYMKRDNTSYKGIFKADPKSNMLKNYPYAKQQQEKAQEQRQENPQEQTPDAPAKGQGRKR